MLEPNVSVVIESDASMQGCFAVCQKVRTGGKWTATEAQCVEVEGSTIGIPVLFEGEN